MNDFFAELKKVESQLIDWSVSGKNKVSPEEYKEMQARYNELYVKALESVDYKL